MFPIAWPEPFGLVMIEGMACGTPVIAFNRGSVPEVIDHGSPASCPTRRPPSRRWNNPQAGSRAGAGHFDRRFTTRRMAEDYVDVYESCCRAGLVCVQ